jgi:DNA-directed RNA polymerase subunit alpha
MQKITLPEKPKIIKQEGNYAVFEIRSCYPGYGITLGNALRRVLLSSLTGSAITSVKISGVNHEFSTIPGVIEDLVEIVLNLKKIRFKMYTDGPVKLTLKANKEGKIKASDIKVSSDIEIVNKDAHIATITDKNSKVEMEIQIEKGIGYIPAEQHSEEKLEIGSIAVDAIFTPVKKVNYKVENMRVGKMTNYNKIILEIETDGSVTPEEALREASRLLVNNFNLFRETTGEKVEKVEKEIKEKTKEVEAAKKQAEKDKITKAITEEKEAKKTEDVLKMVVDDLNISPRISKVLRENKIKSLGKLVRKTESELKSFSGMGDKGLKEIKKSLGKLGLTLKSD